MAAWWVVVSGSNCKMALVIELTARRTDPEDVPLVVADRELGLPATALGRLFEPFTQLDRGSPRRGSGMDLYFCRLVAEAHGGSIRAANREDGGAAFTLHLPTT